jgi:hypothetical protein
VGMDNRRFLRLLFYHYLYVSAWTSYSRYVQVF